MSGTLCVISPGRLATTRDGRVQVDPKTAAGMERYATSWPGDVHFVARAGEVDERSQPFDWPRPQDLAFDVSFTDDTATTVRGIAPRTVLAPLELENAELLGLGLPCALVSDYPLRVRWDNVRLDPRLSSVDRARTAVGLSRRGVLLRRMIRRADGLQCNGLDTYATYAGLSRSPLLYFDTRVTDAQVASAGAAAPPPADTLRLAFSGRWIEQKGVLDAVRVTKQLHDDGIPVRLSLLGGGPLEDQLCADPHPAVRVLGRLDFASQWVPFVRDEVDLMVLPHPQGDSASTFLESMSCGTPVAGYDNRYWRSLQAESGGGWLSAAASADLAELVGSLAADLTEVARTRQAGLEFAAGHTFEREFDRRVQHLLSIGAS
ncbi:glycosyltransferase [Nocardioides glacieisoli]|uniref:glycosyltransferase n=1 Tax=Nocardioides glacieisoli TaxID=1168730 RepID=UPI0013EB016E|nr:glycosyltransferase [Nocardioides glacieisoli]